MKNLRRVLSVLMVVAMLASMVVLASCGLFESKVERMYSKLADAKSYTKVYESESYTKTTMVDFKNLMAYEKTEYKDSDDVETYYWYDEDADKYYSASVKDGKYDEDNMVKYEVEKEEFMEGVARYVVSDAAAHFAKLVEWGLMEEVDGAFIDKDEDGDNKTTYKVEDGALVREYESENYETTTKYYDINKTEFEIPQEVLDAKAEKLD